MSFNALQAKTWRFNSIGDTDVLTLETLPVALPAAGEVLIQMKTIGLNRADVMFRRGTYIQKAVFPSRLGYEGAGIVLAIGEGVRQFSPGDAVSILPTDNLAKYGTYADKLLIPETFLVHKPDSLSWEEASSIWMQYLTAWGGVIHAGGVSKGKTILITAASSSVGLAAIQIAEAAGAKVIASTQTIEKKQRLLDLGVKNVIATEDEPDLYEALVLRLGGEHLDVAFDAVGGPHIEQIAKAMSVGGTMVMHGALSPEITPFPLKVALRKSLTMRGFLFLEVLHDPVLREQARRFILSSIGAGYLRPVIDCCFNFEDMHDAQRYLESNQQIGKIVVTLNT
ncbi:NADPH:quinone reductase-like Zn-dependent oxidoreductase [Acinetobacter lwoffii]|uniref:NADPH:quinone reductase-like Zn-dependent oxidoreductase n=1 Tax=Acinetobacter lwoffii TaxID=28090 RepID=A0AAW8LLK5_ACILW|nr:zinc-dependent alcohol dehydrogenase family protein [Acinetobacter lwoffii]MDR6630983.1 NADPH:quinone reductase-like Zn-dependent oxidoreductase [Acinetobacter lwoffii]